VATILVTGGAGYVGSHVCKALAAVGHTPVTYDNLSRGHREAVQWGLLEEGDVTDAARLAAVLARHKPQAVMHLAGFAYVHESIADPAAYARNNVLGTQVLLAAMKTAGVTRIVASSSCSIYASSERPLTEESPVIPTSPYGQSKVALERDLADADKAWGLRWVALRYFNAAGADPDGKTGETTNAGVRIIPNLFDVALGRRASVTINGADYPTLDGTCVRDFTHVADIATAHLQAMDRLGVAPANIFNLGNGTGFSIRQIIDTVASITGKPIALEVGPRRAGDAAMMVADASLAKRILGWQPRWPALRDMVAHAWAWHRAANNPQRRSGTARS
jgi:UDP-arabinose 4-epimerase